MPLLAQTTYIRYAKETVQGTPVAATLDIPVTKHSGADSPTYIKDQSMVNNIGKVRGIYQGVWDSEFSFDGHLYPEVIGPLLVHCGLADTVSGTAPGAATALSTSCTSAAATI